MIGTLAGSGNGLAADDRLAQIAQNSLFILFWQSNMVGQGSYSHVPDYGLGNAFPAVRYKLQYSPNSTDPPPFVFFNAGAPTSLQPYDIAANVNMGPELTFGRYLVNHKGGWRRPFIGKFALSGSGMYNNLGPTTTPAYPSTGPTLFQQFVSFTQACVIAAGCSVTAFVGEGGWTDGNNLAAANNFQPNVTAFVNALRALFGANVPFIFGKVNNNTVTSTYKDTVRAAQVAYAAADPNSALVSFDDLPMTAGDPHYGGNELATMGERLAKACINLKKPSWNPDLAATAAPWLQGYDVGVSGTGATLTPRWPVEHKTNDVAIMEVTTNANNVPATLTNAQGFTEFSWSPVISHSGTTYAYAHYYWCRATSNNMTAPTITTNNSVGAARIFTFRNVMTVGDPTDVVSTWVNNSLVGSSVAIPGGITSLPNELVALFLATRLGGVPVVTSSGWANADLPDLTVQQDSDYNPASTHTLIDLVTGTKATAGAFGATTATLSSTGLIAGVAISLIPAGGGGGTGPTTMTVAIADTADPVITGADAYAYHVTVTNTGANMGTTISCAVTLDASLTFVSASGGGWTFSVVGQVVTCTRAFAFVGASPMITINVTTGSTALTASTSVALSGSNFTTANATETTVVSFVTKDGPLYWPQSQTEFVALMTRKGLPNWISNAPDGIYDMQEASGNLADTSGNGITLIASGTGLAYQQAVAGFTRKAVTTTDNGTGVFASTSASLPDLSTTSQALFAFYKSTATPGSSRTLATMGTTRVRVDFSASLVTSVVANLTAQSSAGAMPAGVNGLFAMSDHTNQVQMAGDNANAATVAWQSGVAGKKLSFGAGDRTSSPGAYMQAYTWNGAKAERSRQDWHDLQAAFGLAPTWTP